MKFFPEWPIATGGLSTPNAATGSRRGRGYARGSAAMAPCQQRLDLTQSQASRTQQYQQVVQQVAGFSDQGLVVRATAARAVSTPSSPTFCAMRRTPSSNNPVV
jgi:hypothetical protein